MREQVKKLDEIVLKKKHPKNFKIMWLTDDKKSDRMGT